MSLQSLDYFNNRSAPYYILNQLTVLVYLRIRTSLRIDQINMSRYKHFDDELSAADINEAAVLPELDVDEPHQLEFKPQLRNYASNSVSSNNKFNLNYWKIYFSRRTRLERYLIVTILLLLFVMTVSFLTFFYRQHDKNNKKQTEEICLTPACIQVSASIYSGMNDSTNPCEDFYEYACGRWMKTNIIPKGHSSWSTTKELSRKNILILKSILEQPLINKTSSVLSVNIDVIKPKCG